MRSIIAAGAALLVSTLTVLAYASPPDSAWTHGIYDDADHDDVVAFITSGVALVEPIGIVGPIQRTCRLLRPARHQPAVALRASADSVRAPPAS